MDQQTPSLQARTNAKLRYAKVHLDELAALPSLGGDDFDRAHQESFLFHLYGARDAFLIELNHYYGLGLPSENLSPGKLRDALKQRGVQSPELFTLFTLEQDDSSWYRHTKDMRDHSAHIQGVPRAFFIGGDDDGLVKLRNPRTGALTDSHFLDEFHEWFEQMRDLIEKLRVSACASMGSNATLQGPPSSGHP